MKGYCGEELSTKEWKQGTSVSCEKIGAKVISYPNRGIRGHVNFFCSMCKHDPHRKPKESASNAE